MSSKVSRQKGEKERTISEKAARQTEMDRHKQAETRKKHNAALILQTVVRVCRCTLPQQPLQCLVDHPHHGCSAVAKSERHHPPCELSVGRAKCSLEIAAVVGCHGTLPVPGLEVVCGKPFGPHRGVEDGLDLWHGV